MKTIANISQKGGAEKTTLSVHLATAAALSGHSAAIIDLDPASAPMELAGWPAAHRPVVAMSCSG